MTGDQIVFVLCLGTMFVCFAHKQGNFGLNFKHFTANAFSYIFLDKNQWVFISQQREELVKEAYQQH